MNRIDVSCKNDGSEGSPGRHSHGQSLAPKPSRFSNTHDLHKLSDVFIVGCEELLDVTSLLSHAPGSEILHIGYCHSLKDVIVGNVEEDPATINLLFPCLKYLKLGNLVR